MKRFILITLLLLSVLALAGCGGATAVGAPEITVPPVEAPQIEAPEVEVAQAEVLHVETPQADAPQVETPEIEAAEGKVPEADTASTMPGETLLDEQGAVSVLVTPLNLEDEAATLAFEVVMDTHSVDLSMDLSQLATLETDAGIEVKATAWEAPQGGHHVSGVLSFPAEKDATSLLEGALTLTLTLENVAVPVRTFTWNLK